MRRQLVLVGRVAPETADVLKADSVVDVGGTHAAVDVQKTLAPTGNGLARRLGHDNGLGGAGGGRCDEQCCGQQQHNKRARHWYKNSIFGLPSRFDELQYKAGGTRMLHVDPEVVGNVLGAEALGIELEGPDVVVERDVWSKLKKKK